MPFEWSYPLNWWSSKACWWCRWCEIFNDVWDRIDEEIRKQNLNKKELAKRCEFDRKNLFGHRNMRILYFARLCKELNISADYLLFGNDWETEE